MNRIHYLDDDSKDTLKPRRATRFVVIFLIISLVMGIIGATIAVVGLSASPWLRGVLGIKGGTINLTTTKSEKLKLEESSAVIDSVKKVTPSVVSITTSEQVSTFFGQTVEQQGGGTGFIITNDGLILTNKHVAEGKSTLTVTTSDGKNYSARTVSVDPTNDLAILKVEASGLPAVELGDSNDLQTGQWVVAIGNALGELQNTVTVGVISARERQLTAGGGTGTEEQLNNLLQTDAAINPGNSGGPLVNLAGQVVGINTAIAGNAQNIGFAIPINQAKSAIDSYKRVGKIVKPYIGVRYVTINREVVQRFNLSVDHGALIIAQEGQDAVLPDSPAAKAGLQKNDIILEVNGERIDENHTLGGLIAQYQAGDEVDVKYSRDNKETTVKIKLGSTE